MLTRNLVTKLALLTLALSLTVLALPRTVFAAEGEGEAICQADDDSYCARGDSPLEGRRYCPIGRDNICETCCSASSASVGDGMGNDIPRTGLSSDWNRCGW